MIKLLPVIFLFTILSCKEKSNYWNPVGKFPLLEKNGSLNMNVNTYFSLQNIPDNIDVLLINFFAPECKPCIAEVPDLKNIHEVMSKNRNMQFVAIGSRITALSGENIDDVKSVVPDIHRFTREFKINYPTYVAGTSDLTNFGLTGFPETFILNRDSTGKWFVKRKFIGMISNKDVQQFIN